MFNSQVGRNAQGGHERAVLGWLIAAVLLTVVIRATILLVIDEPVVSDALAYLTMATNLVERGELVDNFGQKAFYSPGYPLLLSPFLALFGASPEVARAVNLGLAAISTVLVFAVAGRVARDRIVGLIAAFAFAAWIPSAVGVEVLHKENLSIPLLLGFAWSLLRLVDEPARWSLGLAAGATFGASVLVGASVLLTAGAAALVLALNWRKTSLRAIAAPSVALLVGAGLFVAPWLAHVQRTIGHATLSTNGPFNLYLGNNPAATGSFIGIQDTPIGPSWNRLRAEMGEYGAAQVLGREAARHMAREPWRTARLALTKLTLFWTPNMPDAADSAASPIVAKLRWIEVLQHLVIVVLGVAGMIVAVRARHMRTSAIVIGLIIAGFWVIHAAAYIMSRYRDPIMPLMITFAAVATLALVKRFRRPAHA